MRTLMPGGGPASRLVASIQDMLEPVGRIFVVRLVLRTAQEVSDDDATHLAGPRTRVCVANKLGNI